MPSDEEQDREGWQRPGERCEPGQVLQRTGPRQPSPTAIGSPVQQPVPSHDPYNDQGPESFQRLVTTVARCISSGFTTP
ncbi:hypothetical protein [Streptomyces sp. NBC_01443]|uniref:hypothetical protein n=1 Tax=Streptomyces sp. NBC_01443 TaxID=2903868 RepID=UPI00224F8BC7|nr:hypothetical protein [Streptomyces sp. NBC_01443]MCX4633014.1 hypothetical protein [Streptomyces sp. NBC_01443]